LITNERLAKGPQLLTFRRTRLIANPMAIALVTLLAITAVWAQPAQPPNAQDLMEAVKVLASPDLEGRRTGTPGNAKARAWIVEQFAKANLTPINGSFEAPFSFSRNSVETKGVNVVGTCRGSGAGAQRPVDGPTAAPVMVISAHYDHLGVRDGAIYHGADDNASGVAVVLALARQCQRTPWTHDVVFVAFDAEEMGLQGARAFVAAPPVAKERIALNVNLDMVSRSATKEIYVAGTYHRPALKPLLEPVAARAPIKVLFGHDQPKGQAGGVDDWTTQSDHAAFHAAGVPFVYFGVEDHPDYHKPTDTADKIDARFFAAVEQTVRDAVTVLDRAIPLK
jgi:Zn-dependent M28 family amino/carboxypeptidase